MGKARLFQYKNNSSGSDLSNGLPLIRHCRADRMNEVVVPRPFTSVFGFYRNRNRNRNRLFIRIAADTAAA